MQKTLLAAALVVFTAGCTSVKVKPDEVAKLCGDRPTEEQAQGAIKTYVNSALKDPYSAHLGTYVVGNCEGRMIGLINGGGYKYGWVILADVNAKNSYGGYTGSQTHELLYNNGNVFWMVSN